jgi:hypothetical protein
LVHQNEEEKKEMKEKEKDEGVKEGWQRPR